VTGHESGAAPVGVRPAPDGGGGSPRRLRWVEAGPLTLSQGEQVAGREDGGEWLAEVVVPAESLVEWPALTDLPVVTRRVAAAEWPGIQVTDGRRLLESLALPPGLLARP
jgi:hypothetical protein